NSAASWRTEERPSTKCVQAKAWLLPVEGFDFLRGRCINAGQRKAAKASRLVASTSRSLVSSRLTLPAKSRAFAPVAMEGTGETDSPPEREGFEHSVPRVMDGDSGRQVPALIAVFELAGTAVALQRGTKVVRPDRHPEFR